MKIEGEIFQGKGIASGKNVDPETGLTNTIAQQLPFFEKAGVSGTEKLYQGTLNVNIAPLEMKIKKPDYEVTCEWHPGVTETFWLINTRISAKGEMQEGFIYYPCPSAVEVNGKIQSIKSHPDTTIEILGPKMDVSYGDRLALTVSDDKVQFTLPAKGELQ